MHERHAEGVAQPLRRVAPGPKMPRNGTKRHVEVLGSLAHGARHVAILTLLFAEPCLIEVVAPLQKCLRLFADNSLADGVAVGAHRRALNRRLYNRGMRRIHLIRPSNLSIRSQMAARAGQAATLLLFGTWRRLADLR